MKKIIAIVLFSAAFASADIYFGLGPAFSNNSDALQYWFSGGNYFHRGNFDTKLKVDCASDFRDNVFLSGSLGLNYYFIKDFLLAGLDFGFGSDFDDFGFTGGISFGVALAERTFLIEPSFQAVFREGVPFIAGMKIGMLFGKGE
jgi:hypothetical protein